MAVKLSISICGIDLPQKNLTLCPGQIEDTISYTAILIFLNQN